MEKESLFDNPDFSEAFKNVNSSNNSLDPMWLIILFVLFFGFIPKSDCNESYLRGKVEAYENLLKGLDDDVR